MRAYISHVWEMLEGVYRRTLKIKAYVGEHGYPLSAPTMKDET